MESILRRGFDEATGVVFRDSKDVQLIPGPTFGRGSIDSCPGAGEDRGVGVSRTKNIETLASLYEAFHQQKTWRQAELARHIGVRPERLRTTLEALQDSGWPLEREEEPPQVYWSLPRHWFAGGVLLPGATVPKLLRLLAYLPESPERAEVLRLFDGQDQLALFDVIEPPRALSAEEEAILQQIERSIRSEEPLDLKYFSRYRGELEWRTLSCQRVLFEDAHRFVAVCHRDDSLKWFRLSAVQGVREASEPEYRARAREQVESFIGESIAGYHGPEPKQTHSFVVKEPAARWVKSTLKPPMRYAPCTGGIRVEVETTSVLQVARFVVTLGAAVSEVSPRLASEVRRLAEAALEVAGPTE